MYIITCQCIEFCNINVHKLTEFQYIHTNVYKHLLINDIYFIHVRQLIHYIDNICLNIS